VNRIAECNEIPVLRRHLPDLDKVYIYPLCDLHVGDPWFDERKFRGYLKVIADVPEAYCVFNGDLINCSLPGGVGGEDFWDQKPLTPQKQNELLIEMVKEYSIEDKILAIIGGSNHPARALKAIGHNYDEQFAKDLGLIDRYMEPLGMMFLGVGRRKKSVPSHKKGSSVWYSVIITHGTAGGKLAGSCVNATRGFGGVYAADCVITSHRHLDAVTKDEFYIPDLHNKSVTKIKRMFVSAGTFLGYSKYAQKKGLQPNGTGTPRIRFDGSKKDVHVSV
jgi:hypothetical protein